MSKEGRDSFMGKKVVFLFDQNKINCNSSVANDVHENHGDDDGENDD